MKDEEFMANYHPPELDEITDPVKSCHPALRDAITTLMSAGFEQDIYGNVFTLQSSEEVYSDGLIPSVELTIHTGNAKTFFRLRLLDSGLASVWLEFRTTEELMLSLNLSLLGIGMVIDRVNHREDLGYSIPAGYAADARLGNYPSQPIAQSIGYAHGGTSTLFGTRG